MMNTRKISLFLLLTFGISWVSAGILCLAGVAYGSRLSGICTAILFMGAPATAAIIVQKFIYKQPIKEMGLKLREAKGWAFLRIPLIYLLICLSWIGTIALFGNVFHINGFGRMTFDDAEVLANINEVTKALGGPALSKLPFPAEALLIMQIVSSFLAGAIVNTIFTLGEELGWRGFLYNEMQALGFWKSNLLIGITWGFWHAPIILQGHNYPDHRAAGILIMVLFCLPVGYVSAYGRRRTNSVLAPAILHAGINAIGGNLALYSTGSMDIIGGIAGASGAIACAVVLVLVIIIDRKTLLTKPYLA